MPYYRLETWGYGYKTVNHGIGEYARDKDDDGFHEVHVNTMEGFWSLPRSWLRPHRVFLRKSFRYLYLFSSLFTILENGEKFCLHRLLKRY